MTHTPIGTEQLDIVNETEGFISAYYIHELCSADTYREQTDVSAGTTSVAVQATQGLLRCVPPNTNNACMHEYEVLLASSCA